MDITLEKIELVKDRTGVTYAEAKEALEKADGNVVDAIISIEEVIDEESAPKRIGESGQALMDKIKEIVSRGNVSRIVVSRDDEKILNLPVNAGIAGVVVAPWGILVAVLAAFGFKCKIEIVRTNGSVIDVTDKAGNLAEDAKTKSTQFYGDMKTKAGSFAGDAVTKGQQIVSDIAKKTGVDLEGLKKKAADLKEAAEDKFDDFTEKAEDWVDDFTAEGNDLQDDLEAKAEDLKDAAEAKIEEVTEAAEEKFEEVKDAAEDKIEEVKDAAEEAKDSFTE